MVSSVSDLRKEISDAVRQNIEKEYNELLKLNAFPKDHMWFDQFWICFVKNAEVQITKKGAGIEKRVTPIYKFVPDPTNRIKQEAARFPSSIFNFNTLEPFLHELGSSCKTKVMKFWPDLIMSCLESTRQEIPSMSEIKENLKINIEGFLAQVRQEHEKLRSIAPINGIEWRDDIIDEGVRFSEPSLLDLQDIEIIKQNKRDSHYFDLFYNFQSPVTVVEFEFDWNPDPDDYSAARNIERLHQTAVHKFETILSACRLVVEHPDRVGIGLIFHLNSSWSTYLSTKLITENPFPNFKPILTDGRPVRRDESYYPAQKVSGEDLQDLLKRVATLRNAASGQPVEENAYIELLYAIEEFSRFADEPDLDWKLLDLVKCMESLGNMTNILNNDSNRCQSAGKIIYALGIETTEEKTLILNAYRLRSTRAAHSPIEVTIDKKILTDCLKLSRRLIRNSLVSLFPL